MNFKNIGKSFPALNSPNFRLFLGGQVVSYTGTWLQTVASGWLVLQLSNSPLKVGLVTAAGTTPILLFTLYGGVIADRVNRRVTVLILQALLAIEAIALAILVFSNRITVGWVAGLAAFAGLVTAFEVPVRQSMVVEIVGREGLMNALAFQSSAFNLARVVGPALAGVVIATVGIGACFALNAISFMAVCWSLWRMKMPPTAVAEGPVDVLAAFREGARFVLHERWPRALMTLIMVTTIFGFSFLTMLPVLARNVLDTGASGFGALVSSVGIGALSGALFLAAFGGQLRQRKLALFAAGGLGLALLATALTPGFWTAFLALMATGCAMVLQSITSNTLLQHEAPDHLRGRVMGFYSFVVLGMAPFGAFQIGWVSEHLGVRAAFAIGGQVCLLAMLLVWRGLRTRERHDARANA